jgi:ABC-2 type transport system permease protein
MSSYLALEIRRSMRDRQYLALVVGWPVGAYLLFSAIFGAQPATQGLSVDTGLMVSMATFGAFGAVLIATGPRLALDRQVGWLRQMQLTPLSSTRLFLARMIAAIALTLPAILLTFAVAIAVHGIRLDAWQWPALVLVLCVGCLPFAAIGLVIGSLVEAETAQGLTMVAYLAMAALGGIWMPVSIMPAPLQAIALALPSNRMAELGWRVAAGQAPTLAAVAILAAWFAGAMLVARLVSTRGTTPHRRSAAIN